MKRKNCKIPLAVLSEQREILMGIATLAILFVHSRLNADVIFQGYIKPTLLWHAGYNLLYGGVDLFLLLSGMGLYFSYEKCRNIGSFYKKRFFRILPELYLVIAIWLLVCGNTVTFSQFKDDILFLRFLRDGNRLYWFFSLIILLYLFYPLIHRFYEKCGVLGFCGSLVFVIALAVAGEKFLFPEAYKKYGIALTRIPAFLIGVWVGRCIKKDRCISKIWLIPSGCIWIVIALCAYKNIIERNNSTLYYYAAAYFCLYLAFLLAMLFSRYRLRFFRIGLSWLGMYSMEAYLIYEKVIDRSQALVEFQDETGMALTGICILVTLGLSILLKSINDSFRSRIEKISQSIQKAVPESSKT